MACKLQLSVVSPTLPRTGKDYVDAWMREKCHLIRMAEDQDVNTLLPEFMRYIEQFRGIAGSKCPVRMIFLWDIGLRRIVNVSPALGFNLTLEDPQPKPEITLSFFEACRYIVCLVDFTSMPANAKQVQSSMNVLSTVLGMGSTNIGHVQMPLFHKQTKENTVMNHRRNIEEMMLKGGLSREKEIILLFDKSDCRGTDARSSHQICIAGYHKQFQSGFSRSTAFDEGRIGPVPLLPVSEFYGYDEAAKPGPAERTETTLASISGSVFGMGVGQFT